MPKLRIKLEKRQQIKDVFKSFKIYSSINFGMLRPFFIMQTTINYSKEYHQI
jgi:hypothetical protein